MKRSLSVLISMLCVLSLAGCATKPCNCAPAATPAPVPAPVVAAPAAPVQAEPVVAAPAAPAETETVSAKAAKYLK